MVKTSTLVDIVWLEQMPHFITLQPSRWCRCFHSITGLIPNSFAPINHLDPKRRESRAKVWKYWNYLLSFISSSSLPLSSSSSFHPLPLVYSPPPTPSWALYLLLSSSLAFLHNVFLLSSPVRTCICYVPLLHERAWHLLIPKRPSPRPLTLIVVVFHSHITGDKQWRLSAASVQL